MLWIKLIIKYCVSCWITHISSICVLHLKRKTRFLTQLVQTAKITKGFFLIFLYIITSVCKTSQYQEFSTSTQRQQSNIHDHSSNHRPEINGFMKLSGIPLTSHSNSAPYTASTILKKYSNT